MTLVALDQLQAPFLPTLTHRQKPRRQSEEKWLAIYRWAVSLCRTAFLILINDLLWGVPAVLDYLFCRAVIRQGAMRRVLGTEMETVRKKAARRRLGQIDHRKW